MIDSKTKNELMKIRAMAETVIERIDVLIPQREAERKKKGLTEEAKAKILAHRRFIRYRQIN